MTKNADTLTYLRTVQAAQRGYEKWRSTNSKSKKPRGVLFGEGREIVVQRITAILRDWTTSPFEHEAHCRHGLRTELVCRGYGWQRSDDEAASIVAEGLRNLRALRPSWEQGQREYVFARENCRWCGTALPDDSFLGKRQLQYCSDICAKAAFEHRDFEERSQRNSTYAAVRRALSRAKAKARTCIACGNTFHPIREGSAQRFCSQICKARYPRQRPQYECSCSWCGSSFVAGSPSGKFCSRACVQAANKMHHGQPPKQMLPHVFDHFITLPLASRPAWITPARFDELLAA